MTRRRLTVAQRDARRTARLVREAKGVAAMRGKRLTHGEAETYDRYGCRCSKCRIAKVRTVHRPIDPHYPSHLARPG